MSIQLALHLDEVPSLAKPEQRYHSIAPCLAGSCLLILLTNRCWRSRGRLLRSWRRLSESGRALRNCHKRGEHKGVGARDRREKWVRSSAAHTAENTPY
jgi:hypothetical protein